MDEIRKNIKEQQFHNVYLLYGPEAWLRARFLKDLIRALVPEGEEMNFTRFSGKDTEEDAIISQGETLPFFSERRVILVEDTGFFRNKAEALAAWLEKLPEYLVLIFSEEEADKRTRLFKLVQNKGHVAEFATQKEDALVRWIFARMKKEGKKITASDMQRFLAVTGTDMANIDNELEKLLSYCAEKEVITGRDIDAVCAPQISNQIFDMIRAVTEHRQKDALDLYYDLLALKEKPMRILYLIARQYNQLLQIEVMSREGMPQQEIASKAGVPPFVVRRSLGLLRQYSGVQLRGILEDLTRAEEEVKTGRLDERLSVELAIVRLSA
ncbi:MAG: DNA polymerase III subunit delta [Eubacterium sp.]|nr:DNA polymerase III subunit delta [Eubacterium sp.]